MYYYLKIVLEKFLAFFRKKETIRWELSESEKKKLEAGTKKYFIPCLDLINEFTKGGSYRIMLTYENRNNNTEESQEYDLAIQPSNFPGIAFKITAPKGIEVGGVKYKESYGLDNPLTLLRGSKKYSVAKNSVIDFSNNFPRLPLVLTGIFTHFKSDNAEEKNIFRRLLIQVKDPDMIYPTDILEFRGNQMKFDISSWDWQQSLIGLPFLTTKGMFAKVKIKDSYFHFYALEQINSYVIDSTERIDKNQFFGICNAIRTAFAFLSGKFYRDVAIYFTSPDVDFTTVLNFEIFVEPQTIITENQIINPDFFFEGYKSRSKEIQDVWAEHHKMFSVDVFSNLCEKLLQSTELLRALELIINAGSIPDPVQKGALYSVALETLTEYHKAQHEEAFKPIKDKALSKELLESLNSQLGKIKTRVTEKEYAILSKKIENINSPTNKDKLTKPFELLSLKLSEEDKKMLDQRNRYLHGDQPKSIETETELLDIAHHLHSLAAKLVLKLVGYSGHFIHLPSWHTVRNKDNFTHINPEEVMRTIQKIDAGNFSTREELDDAKRVIENYRKFLKFSIAADKLIEII